MWPMNLALLSLLPSLLAVELAGNEDYAWKARRSLKTPVARRSSSVSFSPETVTFSVGDKQYLSPTGSVFKSYSVKGSWGLDDYKGSVLPVTVFHVDGEVTCDVLGDKVAKYESTDDVWDSSFMNAIFLTTNTSFHVASDVAGCVRGWGGSLIIKSGDATSDVSDIGLAAVNYSWIPQGPYLAKIDGDITLTEIYRNYKDEQQAFTTASIAATDGTFVDVASPAPGLNTLSIPVPSRLYYVDLPNPRPLEGVRIAVKDIYDMAGLKTGGGSRAYWHTYPVKTKTAYSIQRLLDLGVVIVGRAKTSQYANGESATADWVDQMCPYNPRGDGYQQPSSSSSGPGAAIGAYDWLDNTIGSDTGGSITGPASYQGVFGVRPSWGAISLDGVIPLQATQDTAGFFARDAVTGSAFSKAWYGDTFKSYSRFPKSLILPNSSWTFAANYSGADQFNTFKQGLLDLIQPSTIDTRNLEGIWNDTGRFDQVGGESLNTHLGMTYWNLITYYQWHNFGKQWVEDYQSQHDGRVPFISPSPATRWAYARNNLTEESFNSSLADKQFFKDFIDQEVLVADSDVCSSSLMIYPFTLGSTTYRNIYLSPPKLSPGFGSIAQFSGIPQMVIPVGQVPYESTITNHTEYLPITATAFAAAGCDYVLWDLAVALQNAGVISPVSAGSLAYPDKV